MIRPAIRPDLPRILEIRDSAGAERLSDPRALTDAVTLSLVDAGAVQVWQAVGEPVTGFAAIDAATGAIAALLVAPGQQGRGFGRALLAAACEALRSRGLTEATITLEAGTAGERHYRAAGWTSAGTGDDGRLTLRQRL